LRVILWPLYSCSYLHSQLYSQHENGFPSQPRCPRATDGGAAVRRAARHGGFSLISSMSVSLPGLRERNPSLRGPGPLSREYRQRCPTFDDAPLRYPSPFLGRTRLARPPGEPPSHLITRRSQVQILAPLPKNTRGYAWLRSPFLFTPSDGFISPNISPNKITVFPGAGSHYRRPW